MPLDVKYTFRTHAERCRSGAGDRRKTLLSSKNVRCHPSLARLLGTQQRLTGARHRLAKRMPRAKRGRRVGRKGALFFLSADYTTMDAAQDKHELGRLLRQELEPNLQNFDYVYTFGTTVSKATKEIVNNRVPQIFTIVADPVGAGVVQSLEATGGNISGATNAVPHVRQIEAALKIMSFKRLGLLFNPREKNAMLVRQSLYDMADKFHFEIVDLRSPPAENMLEQNLQKLIDQSVSVDVVFLPPDSYLLSKDKVIGDRLRQARVKSIGTLERFVKNGALVGVVPDYSKLGKAAAGIVDRHQKGESLQTIPVQLDEDPRLIINKTTAALLQVTIPETVLKNATLIE